MKFSHKNISNIQHKLEQVKKNANEFYFLSKAAEQACYFKKMYIFRLR